MEQKGPRTVFRLLALLLLGLAMAETPLGTGLVFAEEQTRPAQRSREMRPGDLPARHALPEKATTEASVSVEFQATASYSGNGFDDPVQAIAEVDAALGEHASVGVTLAQHHPVPAPAYLGNARDPPLAA